MCISSTTTSHVGVSFRNNLCIYKHFKYIQMRGRFPHVIGFLAYTPMHRWGRGGPGVTQQLPWAPLHVRLGFCLMHLVEFLFSVIPEALLLGTCSLGSLLISNLKRNVVFFLFAFSTFSFHDLKKKVSTNWAGLKGACLQHDMGPGSRPAKLWCKVLQTHFPSGNWFISIDTLQW